MKKHGLRLKLGSTAKFYQVYYRLIPYLYEYEESTDKWNSVSLAEVKPSEYERCLNCKLSICQVEDGIMVGLGNNSFDDPKYNVVKFTFRGANNFSDYVPDKDRNSKVGYSMNIYTTLQCLYFK